MSTHDEKRKVSAWAGMAAVLVSLSSCSHDPARDQASPLVRVVTELRMAPNEAKRAPLERLRGLPCTHEDICAAKNSCVEAFDHHVRGIELGLSLRASLDGGSPRPSSSASGELSALLLEMNVEVEEGRRRMTDCDERMAALRRKHRL